jgi:hypothetical protein
MGSVLFAVGTESLSPKAWLLGGALGAIAFCSALVLTGELTFSDLKRGARVVTAAISRFTRSRPRRR